jgi:hypothetical protein
MELNSSREAASSVSTRKLSTTFWKARVYCRVHKCPLPFSILCRSIQPTPPHPLSPSSILTFLTNLRLDLPNGLFSSVCPANKLHAFFSYSGCPAYPVNPVHFNMIILTALGKKVQGLKLLIIFFFPNSYYFFSP